MHPWIRYLICHSLIGTHLVLALTRGVWSDGKILCSCLGDTEFDYRLRFRHATPSALVFSLLKSSNWTPGWYIEVNTIVFMWGIYIQLVHQCCCLPRKRIYYTRRSGELVMSYNYTIQQLPVTLTFVYKYSIIFMNYKYFWYLHFVVIPYRYNS